MQRLEEHHRARLETQILEKKRIQNEIHQSHTFKNALNCKKIAPKSPQRPQIYPEHHQFSKSNPLKKKEDASADPVKQNENEKQLLLNIAHRRIQPKKEKNKDTTNKDDDTQNHAGGFFPTHPTMALAPASVAMARHTNMSEQLLSAIIESIESSAFADGTKNVSVLIGSGFFAGTQIQVRKKENSKISIRLLCENSDAKKTLEKLQNSLKKKLLEKHIALGELHIH